MHTERYCYLIHISRLKFIFSFKLINPSHKLRFLRQKVKIFRHHRQVQVHSQRFTQFYLFRVMLLNVHHHSFQKYVFDKKTCLPNTTLFLCQFPLQERIIVLQILLWKLCRFCIKIVFVPQQLLRFFRRLLHFQVDSIGFVNIFQGFSDFLQNIIWHALNKTIIETSSSSSCNLLYLMFFQVNLIALGVSSFDSSKYYLFYVKIQSHSNCICSHKVGSYVRVELPGLLFSTIWRQATIYHRYFWGWFSLCIDRFDFGLLFGLLLLFSLFELFFNSPSDLMKSIDGEFNHTIAFLDFADFKNLRY